MPPTNEYASLVSARKLHHDLNIGTNFTRWFWSIITDIYDPALETEKIVPITLTEGKDYVCVYEKKRPGDRGRYKIDDYMLTQEAADKIRDYYAQPGRTRGRHRKSPKQS